MAVQARYGGLAGAFPAECFDTRRVGTAAADGQKLAAQEYAARMSAAPAVGKNGYYGDAVASGAQSGLTCNNNRGGGGGGAGVVVSRKRGREVEQYAQVQPSSTALLLPIPGMTKMVPSSSSAANVPASGLVEPVTASTSGRVATTFGDALASSELYYLHNAEVDALVRVECERLRAGLEHARKRQCVALVRAASALAMRRLQEKQAELEASRRRAADLEERLRQAAAESQAWCGLARRNEAVAAGLRAALDNVVLLRASAPPPAEGCGDHDAADDAQSRCGETKDVARRVDDGASSVAGRWACKACGEREAEVLLLPCRHLCLCTACEPKLDTCPVCLAGKNASVVARSPTDAW